MTTTTEIIASPFEQIAQAAERRKTSALAEYRVLINRTNQPQKGDGEKLLAACRDLGITVEDAQDDADAWEKYNATLREIDRLNDDTDLRQRADKLQAECVPRCIAVITKTLETMDVNQIIGACRTGLSHTNAAQDVWAIYTEAEEAAKAIRSRSLAATHADQSAMKLRRDNPRVFGE